MHTDPFRSNVSGTTVIDGKTVPVARAEHHRPRPRRHADRPDLGLLDHYFLGVDNQGRDVMARLLYGGRNSLLIGVVSALLCCLVATVLGLLAGYFGGIVDGILLARCSTWSGPSRSTCSRSACRWCC